MYHSVQEINCLTFCTYFTITIYVILLRLLADKKKNSLGMQTVMYLSLKYLYQLFTEVATLQVIK
jgi:hypothetical protein